MDIDNTDYSQHEKILYCLELYYNLLKWSVIHNDIRKNQFEINFDKSFDFTINAILENIIYILEKSNYCIREKNKDDMIFPQYLLYKRDASVDAVLEYVPEISDILLGYLDFRNRNDRDYKKSVIIQLYNFMEPNRTKYKGYICGSISEEFFVSSNKLGIRHNDKNQIKIHYTKRIQIYDKLFKMALFVILTEQITQYKNDLVFLRSPN